MSVGSTADEHFFLVVATDGKKMKKKKPCAPIHLFLAELPPPPTLPQPFEEQATADKARYASEGGGAASSKPKIPRGPNAYAVFLKEIRPSVVEAEPGLTFGEVGRKVAELWRGMSDGEKDTFKAKAALLKPGASDE